VRLLSRAKIVFNHSVRREMNMRCYEAMGCGALLFTEEGNLETPDHLRNGEDSVFYREDNFIELLEHFLDDDEARLRIAEEGRRKSVELAGEFRLEAVFDAIEKEPFGPRGFHRFDEPTRRLADVMQLMQSQTPGQSEQSDRALEAGLTQHPDRAEFQLAAGLREYYFAPAQAGPEREQSLAAAARRFRMAAKIDPTDAIAWFNLARTLEAAGDMQSEFDALQQALQATTSRFGSLLLMRLDDPYYTHWMRAYATGQSRIELLQSGAASRMAEILLSIGRNEDARNCAEIATALCSEIATPFRWLALAQEKAGQVDEAAELLETSLALAPLDNRHRLELLRLWTAMGRRAEAIALAQQTATILTAFPGAESLAQHFQKLASEL
jgi:tetratricopeptide (TPR) repeat protein